MAPSKKGLKKTPSEKKRRVPLASARPRRRSSKLYPRVENPTGSFLKQFRPITKARQNTILKLIELNATQKASDEILTKSTEISFSREDLSDLYTHKPEPFTTVIESVARMICKHANQELASDNGIPSCLLMETYAFHKIKGTEEDHQDLSQDLKTAGGGTDSFFGVKRIFILCPIHATYIEGQGKSGDNHLALLVISPKFKTIDYLDSENPKLGRVIPKNIQNVLQSAFRFLIKHLDRQFVWKEWRYRSTRAFLQPDGSGDCTTMVMANTMALAFGYSLLYDDYENMENKRQRMASELLNGELTTYQGYDGDEREEGEFAYEFGEEDEASFVGQQFESVTEGSSLWKEFCDGVQNNWGVFKSATSKQELLNMMETHASPYLTYDPAVMLALENWIHKPRHELRFCLTMVERLEATCRETISDIDRRAVMLKALHSTQRGLNTPSP